MEMPMAGNRSLAVGIKLECLSKVKRGLDAELGLFEELLPPLDFQLLRELLVGCFRRFEVCLAVELELDIPVPRIGALIDGHWGGLSRLWASPPSQSFAVNTTD